VADLAECYARVYKVPKALYFNPDDPLSMDWETEMELQVGDMVWFSIMESKNSPEILCEKTLYKSIPYADMYVAKRRGWAFNVVNLPSHISPKDVIKAWNESGQFIYKYNKANQPEITALTPTVIPLNGYVLCERLFKPQISPLDALSENMIDNTRGRVKFVGTPPEAYLRESYCHIDDIRVGDGVMFDNPAVVFLLERTKALATFDGDNLYWVIPRRRISLILNR